MFGLVNGTVKRTSGTSGTVDNTIIPAGSVILQVLAHATSAGKIRFSQDSTDITLPASASWFVLQEQHPSLTMPTGGTIVMTGTDSYLIEYMGPAGQR